jgi:hypothetical protein
MQMSELTIKALEQMPRVKTKAKKKADIRKLLEKFDSEKMNYAEIPVTKEHTAKGLRISIGRILKSDKRKDIETYESLDGKSVILKRVK